VPPAPGAESPPFADVTVLCDGAWRNASGITLILPLSLSQGSFADRGRVANTATLLGGRSGEPCWGVFPFQRDLLVGHVRKHLAPGGDGATGRVYTLTRAQVNWLNGPRAANAVWSLRVDRTRSVPFTITRAHLFLFVQDIAFVGIEVQPSNDSLADWLDLAHYARFYGADRTPQVVLAGADMRGFRAVTDLFVGHGLATTQDRQDGQVEIRMPGLRSLFVVLLATMSLPGEAAPLLGPEPDVWMEPLGAPCQLLSYSMLNLAGDGQLSDAVMPWVAGAHHARQTISARAELDAVTVGMMRYGENETFVMSGEGAAFVAVRPAEVVANPSSFQSSTLSAHLRSDYLFAYIFSAYQRYALMRLSEEVAASVAANARDLRPVHERVLKFTALGLFEQISHSQHHHAFYRKARAVHQVRELHREVRDEVEALYDWQRFLASEQTAAFQAEQRRLADAEAQRSAADQKRLERRSRFIEVSLAILTAIVVPMQLVAALFPGSVSQWPYLKDVGVSAQAYGALALVVFILVAMLVALWLLGRSRSKQNRRHRCDDWAFALPTPD
jgi:hypothetical protein